MKPMSSSHPLNTTTSLCGLCSGRKPYSRQYTSSGKVPYLIVTSSPALHCHGVKMKDMSMARTSCNMRIGGCFHEQMLCVRDSGVSTVWGSWCRQGL